MSLSSQQKTSTSLQVHEWLAISIVIGMIASIAVITQVHGSRIELLHQSYAKKHSNAFDVLVKGAVDFPGVYHLHGEMQMKDILSLAGVKADADLRRYSLDVWVKKGRVVNVPVMQFITIHLQGAVKGKTDIKLPKGSKVSDILNVAALADDADVQPLQKKRLLKDNETIFVPTLH